MRRTFGDMSYQRPSRFLREIEMDTTMASDYPSQEVQVEPHGDWLNDSVEHVQFRVGQSVWHGQYGEGTVSSLSRGKASVVTVKFPGIGQKKILADFLSPYGTEGQSEW